MWTNSPRQARDLTTAAVLPDRGRNAAGGWPSSLPT